jgi:hypothetical protein
MPLQEDGRFLTEALPERISTGSGLDAHTRNFLECIRSRKDPNCSIEMGRNAAVVAHLGNIAYRTGDKLNWNEGDRRIANVAQANKYLIPTYRNPWQLWEG